MTKYLSVLLAALLFCACSNNLHRAVSLQDYREVTKFVETGADINAAGRHGSTPLMLAAYYGNAPIVKYLCDRGADVNRQNHDGWTALLYAAYYGHEDIAKILLDHQASVHPINKFGYNALWYAQRFEWHKIVLLLKAAGAKPLF